MPAVASAQVAKHVEVTKDYAPSVSQAQKLSSLPDMTDTVTMRPDIDYTITPRSYETSLETRNFKPATITYWDYSRSRPLYASVAMGAPLQSEADAYISTFNKDKGYAMAYVNHWGDYRNRRNLLDERVKKSTAEMSNRIGGRAGLVWGRHLLEADIYGDQQLRHRYPTTGEKIHFGKLQGKVRLGDDFTDLSRWNFNIEAGGGFFLDGNKGGNYNQSNFEAKAAVGKMLGQHLFKLHVSYSGVYGAKTIDAYKNGTLMAGLRYGFSGKRFEFVVGADYYYDKVSESVDSPHHIFPNLKMTWKNRSQGFIPFVEVDGGLRRHDFASLMYENPFFTPIEGVGSLLASAPNEAVYNGRAGFGGVLGRGVFAYNLSAELSFANDHFYWFANNANYYFTSAYQHSLRIDGSILLRPAAWFEAELKAGVYVWENYDNHYSNRPNFETSLKLSFVARRFSADINFGYRGGIKWMTMAEGSDTGDLIALPAPPTLSFSHVKTDSELTLGLYAEYRINDRWGVFAEGRNFTGSRIYEWYGYYRDSAEGLLGVKFTF
jgi:hypothetical protein